MRKHQTLTRTIATSCVTGALVLAGCTPHREDLQATTADSAAVRNQQGAMAMNNAVNNTGAMGGAGGLTDETMRTQLDDAQIADVAMTANRLDSTNAATVLDRLRHADVQAFARLMITDHGAMLDSLRAVSSRLGSTPSGNSISTAMEQMALRPLAGEGATLDREYMDNEVAMHTQLLRTLDDALLPQVRDASLRTLLERMRTAVAAHLRDAEAIRSQMVSN